MILCQNEYCKHCLDSVCRFTGTLEVNSDGECISQKYEPKKVSDVMSKKLYMAYMLMGGIIDGSRVELEYLKETVTLPKVMISADGVGLVDEDDRLLWIDSMDLSIGEQVIIDVDLMELT